MGKDVKIVDETGIDEMELDEMEINQNITGSFAHSNILTCTRFTY